MIRVLTPQRLTGWHPGIIGTPHPELYGDLTNLRGDLTNPRFLWGVIHPDLRGDVTGLWGHLTGLQGDLDACGLTDADRARGVYIGDLVAP